MEYCLWSQKNINWGVLNWNEEPMLKEDKPPYVKTIGELAQEHQKRYSSFDPNIFNPKVQKSKPLHEKTMDELV